MTTKPKRAKAPKPRSPEEEKAFRLLTIQLLHLRNEIYRGGGMDKETFTYIYLNDLGAYERNLAREENIEL